MKPENVNPKNFTVKSIVYANSEEGFSIAIGTWSDSQDSTVAMRWTGDFSDENDKGYPKTFGNPMWFQLPTSFSKIILKSLLDVKGSNNDTILNELKELYGTR